MSVAKDTMVFASALGEFAGKLWKHGQSYLVYPAAFAAPEYREEVVSPERYGLRYELVELDAADGVKVLVYSILQRQSGRWAERTAADDDYAATRPTVFTFHGNGMNFSGQLPCAKLFYQNMRCNIVMLSYRGYGNSEGVPSEKGIQMDAQAALDYILQHPVLQRTKIILYGQSLGGAVAIDLLSRNTTKVHALIVENTFLSLPKMVRAILPVLSPFSVFCSQKWDSEKAITRIPQTVPILMLSGKADEVVPAAHMERLCEIARGPAAAGAEDNPNRVWRQFVGRRHNDTAGEVGYWTAVTDFVARMAA